MEGLVRRADRSISVMKEHPVSFTLQAVGMLAVTASVVTVPVLGAAGFAATGPVGWFCYCCLAIFNRVGRGW
jgi:hypothetical protein